MIAKRSLLFGVVMALCAAPVLAQTSTSLSSSPSSSLTPPNAYTGSVPNGKATQEVLKIGFADAIERGLKYNLGLLLTEQGITSSRGERWKQLSDILPNLTASTTETAQKVNLQQEGFTKIRIPNSPFANISPLAGPFGYFDTRAYGSASVFDWSAIQKVRSSSENLRASQFSYKNARELVVLTVGYNYLLSISAVARVETAQAQLKTAEALYNQASDQLKAGTSPEIDALRAKVEFQTRKQQLIAARNDYEKQRLAFARAIGLPPGQGFELTEKIPYDKPEPISIDAAEQQAYTARPDFLAAQAQVHAAELARRAAIAEYFPTLSVDANYGAGGTTPEHMFGTYEAVGSLKVPIFQGGKVHADTLKADADLTNNRNQLENLRAQIDQDVRDAVLDLQSASEQVEVARSNVDLAGQTLDQARDRFIAGVTDNIEVVQAQDAVASANESYISSLFNYTVARLSLARAEGVAESGVLNYLRGKGDATKDGN
jgi:outer membrane protein TolC